MPRAVGRFALALFLLFLLLVVAPTLLAAQTGTIRGRLADSTGAPLPHASVVLATAD